MGDCEKYLLEELAEYVKEAKAQQALELRKPGAVGPVDQCADWGGGISKAPSARPKQRRQRPEGEEGEEEDEEEEEEETEEDKERRALIRMYEGAHPQLHAHPRAGDVLLLDTGSHATLGALLDFGEDKYQAGRCERTRLPSVFAAIDEVDVKFTVVGHSKLQLVLTPKELAELPDDFEKGTYASWADVEARLPALVLKSPFCRGVVEDWADMELVWRDMYFSKFKLQPGTHPVILAEGPCCPLAQREEKKRIMFDALNAPMVAFVPSAALHVMNTAEVKSGPVIDGCYLNVGYHESCAVFVRHGFVSGTVKRVSLGARTVIEFLAANVTHDDLARVGGDIPFDRTGELSERLLLEHGYWLIRRCRVPPGEGVTTAAYSGQDPFMLAPNALFCPGRGVHVLLNEVINACFQPHQHLLWRNVAVSGGAAKISGFLDRLEDDLRHESCWQRIAAEREAFSRFPIKVRYSEMASAARCAATLHEPWVTQEEYREALRLREEQANAKPFDVPEAAAGEKQEPAAQ